MFGKHFFRIKLDTFRPMELKNKNKRKNYKIYIFFISNILHTPCFFFISPFNKIKAILNNIYYNR